MSIETNISIILDISSIPTWLDMLIEAFYKDGMLCVNSFSQLNRSQMTLKLLKNNARFYLDDYLGVTTAALSASLQQAFYIDWDLPEASHEIKIRFTERTCTVTLYLPCNKWRKNDKEQCADIQRYIRFLIKTMEDFSLLGVLVDDDCFRTADWYCIDGEQWEFQLQLPQPATSVQMIAVTCMSDFTQNFLKKLVQQVQMYHYEIRPVLLANTCYDYDMYGYSVAIEQLVSTWLCVCDGTKYTITIHYLKKEGCTRLLFCSEVQTNPHALTDIIHHTLAITSHMCLERFCTFDSRYNIKISDRCD